MALERYGMKLPGLLAEDQCSPQPRLPMVADAAIRHYGYERPDVK